MVEELARNFHRDIGKFGKLAGHGVEDIPYSKFTKAAIEAFARGAIRERQNLLREEALKRIDAQLEEEELSAEEAQEQKRSARMHSLDRFDYNAEMIQEAKGKRRYWRVKFTRTD